jgi:DNA-binding MarR family transcriptional regulator
MENPFRFARDIKVISNLLKRQIGNCESGKYVDEVTGNNAFIIGYLADHKDIDVFQKDLEDIFSVRRSTMSNIIARMEDKGFLVRTPVGHDARLKKLVLTEKGEAIHALMETNVTAVEQTLIAGFSDEEKETLFRLLQKLRTNLENDNGSK